MTPAQQKQAEELKALQTKLHSDWLKHPVTVDMLRVLQNRMDEQIKQLQENILVRSDAVMDERYRTSIHTIKALLIVIKDTSIFTDGLNKLTPNT